MEYYQQNARGDGLGGVYAGTGKDEAQIANGGVCKDFFTVALTHRHGGGGQEREGAAYGQTLAQEGACVTGGKPKRDVNPSLDHGA